MSISNVGSVSGSLNLTELEPSNSRTSENTVERPATQSISGLTMSTTSYVVSLSHATLLFELTPSSSPSTSSSQSTQSTAPVSPSLTLEDQLLTTLTGNALTALGLASSPNASGTQISMGGMGYYNAMWQDSINPPGVLDSTLMPSTQTGEGQIVTANGQHFTFTIGLKIDAGEQAASPSATSSTSQLQDFANLFSNGQAQVSQTSSTSQVLDTINSTGLGISAASNPSTSSNTTIASNSSQDLGRDLLVLLEAIENNTYDYRLANT